MSKADELKTRAARVAARAVKERDEPPVAPVRADPVRITVDLAPLLYGKLQRWINAAAEQTGQTVRLSSADLIRALLQRLDDDPATDPVLLADVRRLAEERAEGRRGKRVPQ